MSSVAYAAVPQWAATTAYTVGQFVRRLAAPTDLQFHVFRCTTAGTSGASEPSWGNANNNTTTSGTAVFTNVAGQSTYGWSAAAGKIYSMGNAGSVRFAGGDRVFVSSDHVESIAGSVSYQLAATTAYAAVSVISVNRAGSVPPVVADEVSGAAITSAAGSITLEAATPQYWQGITFTVGALPLYCNSARNNTNHFKNCVITTTSSAAGMLLSNNNPSYAILENTRLQFGGTGQRFGGGSYASEFVWLDTPSAIAGAIIPTTLFVSNGNSLQAFTCRGVDLSAITGTLCDPLASGGVRLLFDSCKIASGVTRFLASQGVNTSSGAVIELVNCHDGTNTLNERYAVAGTVTTDRTTYLTAGAQDTIGNYSLKLGSSVNSDNRTVPLESFWLDTGNTATGSSKTATVEIVSSASLNNDDISLLLEYPGTASSSVASFASTLPAVTATPSALPTSSATWTNPPATPVKQYLRTTFTPQTAGRVRGLVRLGKTSTTVWVNPQITIA